jgi:hypothetical protein
MYLGRARAGFFLPISVADSEGVWGPLGRLIFQVGVPLGEPLDPTPAASPRGGERCAHDSPASCLASAERRGSPPPRRADFLAHMP